MPWGATELFQVDERIASPGSEDRNLTHMVLGLSMDHQSALRPMPVTQRDLEAAARDYESSLPERLDLVHLGLGPDGHTASLVPGDPVLEVDDRRVALTGGKYQGHRRMTLTYPAIDSARRILWLVTGAEKRGPLAKLLAGDTSIPAGRVRTDEHGRSRRRGRGGRKRLATLVVKRQAGFDLRQLAHPRVIAADHPFQQAFDFGQVDGVGGDQDLLDVEPVLGPIEHRLADRKCSGVRISASLPQTAPSWPCAAFPRGSS